MDQLELHKKIDEILRKNPEEVEKQEVLELMPKGNFDAKNYFFANADERWIERLWDKNFLDIIKTRSEETTKYCATPEINYIARVAKNDSEFVVSKIILDEDIATSKDKFRPELVNQILRICSELPAELLVKVVPKIKGQNWVKLMSPLGQWGFEYEKMFGILYKAGKIDELIDLAEVVLSIKSKTEFDEDTFNKNPFYIKDFSYTKVFEYLGKIEGKDKKKVLELLTDVVADTVTLGKEKEDKEYAFKFWDTFHLYDVDFFEDEYAELKHRNYRDSAKDLMLFVAKIAKDLIEEKRENENEDKAREIFDKYIGSFDNKNAKLPDTCTMWRLRLFILSLYPKAFKDELKKSFLRLFEVMGTKKYYYDIISGAEYEKALKESFPILDEKDQQKYIEKVIENFKKRNEEDNEDKKDLHLRCGSDLLSVISSKIKGKKELEKLLEKAKKAGFKINPEHKPEPSIKMDGFASRIISRGPITQEEFDDKSIDEILDLLQNEWTPEKLNKQNESNDFHKPKNAEGAGNLLQTGVSNRFDLFVENAEKFFNKKEIDEHYTQSFLRGIQEAIKNGKRIDDNDWQPIINLLKDLIGAKLENRKRKEGFYDGWLGNWQAVYYAMTDVLQELLSEKNEKVVIGDFEKYRSDLLHILEFLLKYKNDPKPEDEKTKSASSTTLKDDGSTIISDPYSIVINSVRGRAFQVFLMFIYQDGKGLEKKEIKINKDIEDLYEEILKEENTRAMMFMYGHHLPTFYFRDKKWAKEVLIPQTFESKKNKYLKLASIEGYLTQTLYKEIFEDVAFKKLYKEWISLEDTKYPNQKHFKDVDEALAVHMALAFINFDIDIEKDLLKTFWTIVNSNNPTRHYEFISFVGRDIISRDNADTLAKVKKINLKKIEKFWDWALENIDDKKALSGFGHWINPNVEVLSDEVVVEKIAKTLKKSDGDIDWDYALIQRLPEFAKKDPENTLSVIKNYLLDKDEKPNQHRGEPIFHIDKEIHEALDIIYKENDELKQDVEKLIDLLIKKGSQIFWDLKDIIENNPDKS